MSWTYESSTGWLYDPSGAKLAQGYSGHGNGLNNPSMQNVVNVGPIPEGWYTRGDPVDSPEHGPEAIPLVPDATNEMYGRNGFYEHGDEIAHPGQHLASLGCVILAKWARDEQVASPDRRLQVVARMSGLLPLVVTDPGLAT